MCYISLSDYFNSHLNSIEIENSCLRARLGLKRYFQFQNQIAWKTCIFENENVTRGGGSEKIWKSVVTYYLVLFYFTDYLSRSHNNEDSSTEGIKPCLDRDQVSCGQWQAYSFSLLFILDVAT